MLAPSLASTYGPGQSRCRNILRPNALQRPAIPMQSQGCSAVDAAPMKQLHQFDCVHMPLVAIHSLQDHVKTPHRAHRIWRYHA
jgi:hypothetical protein